MYQKAYGIIETLAPLHVGASAGEETGNLNLIFRDQFTQTGIIPGSSIRGRFRADMRSKEKGSENKWYGHEVIDNQKGDGGTTEAIVKFEYASLVWLPVFCPGQPIVWVSSPALLKRYKRIAQITEDTPSPYTNHTDLKARTSAKTSKKTLFFNLGFLELDHEKDLSSWVPAGFDLPVNQLVVVDDNDIAMIHDMALYRQTRVALEDNQKKAKDKGLFNVEALPVGSVLVFPIAMKKSGWKPFGDNEFAEMYFGGLESIGFGKCLVKATTAPVINVTTTSSLSGGHN